MNFIDEENIVIFVDFDCGITFYPETPTKVRQINRKGNYTSRSCDKPYSTPSKDQHNVLFMSSVAHISFWTRTVYGRWFKQLLFDSTTLMIVTLCPSKTLNQQLADLKKDSNPVFSSMRMVDSEGKYWASALHCFKNITYRTDEWMKQLLQLKNFVIAGSSEQ